MSNPVKPTSRAGLGIVNRYGEFWSTELFENAEAAEAHFRGFWNCFGHFSADWSDYRLVPARVTIEEISE